MQVGGGRWDSGDFDTDDRFRKGSDRDVLSCNVASRIESKVSVDEGILGEGREEVFLVVVMVLVFESSNMGEDVEVGGGGGRDRGTCDNVCGGIGDVEEGIFLRVVKGGPDKARRRGGSEDDGLRCSWDEDGRIECRVVEGGRWGAGDGDDGWGRPEGVSGGTWEIPSVAVAV